MNKKIKYIISIFCVISLFLSINVTFAADIIDDALGNAHSWNSNQNMGSMSGVTGKITDLITDIITTIGTLLNVVVFASSAILGCRYIWGGNEIKAKIKESLPNLLVAAICIYAYDVIGKLFLNGDDLGIIGVLQSGDVEAISANIWGIVSSIVNVVSVMGVVTCGLKYMFTPAGQKAEIKNQLSIIALGLVLVYCTSSIMTFVVNGFRNMF